MLFFYVLQEKGKVTFEEFALDAERRAHGMRLEFDCAKSNYFFKCLYSLQDFCVFSISMMR